MYTEPASSRAETAAAQIAHVFGSWQFLLFLVLAIVTWCAVNVVMRLFDPHPSAMLAYLGMALAVVAVLQGALILLTQHREAARDRAREIEISSVCQNTEADLHAIRAVIEEPMPGMPPSVGDGRFEGWRLRTAPGHAEEGQ